MKWIFLLIAFGFFSPVYAEESTLNDIQTQLDNQINQQNLKKLEQRVSNLENQSSFEDQFVSSEEYTKLMSRLHILENNDQLKNELISLKTVLDTELSEMNSSMTIAQKTATDSFLLGIYISIGFAGIAIGATMLYSRKMEIQTELIKTDIKTRIRPILSRKELEKKVRNSNEQLVKHVFTLTRHKALFHFQNTGTLPAVNISRNYYAEIRETPSDVIKLNPKEYVDVIKMATLAPNEYYSTDVFWLDPCFDNAVDRNNCYFGLVIWYHDSKGTRYYYHIEGFFDHGELMITHVDMN
ncbi:MAG: hypothetical protein K5785_03455 [Nitrosarchaeum sp.]|nr:hypothetical protein [Nitrosarchaeum sp.]